MSNEKVKALIKDHEGLSLTVYKDTVGIPTVGYGHALLENSSITHEVADKLFESDFTYVIDDYLSLRKEGWLPTGLGEVREAVVLDMLFNLGRSKFVKFRNFTLSLKLGDWAGAARHMKDSLWYNQVGRRGKRLVEMMETGEWPANIGK